MTSEPLARRLLIQGATGSIGSSTLAVVRAHTDRFQVAGIGARSNVDGLLAAAREFHPRSISLEDATHAKVLREYAERNAVTRIYVGPGASLQQAAEADYDLLVNAQLGSAGLEPTMTALERGISVALANKETLVAAGTLVMGAAAKHRAHVIPIDSEHSAILQCLIGESRDSIRKIWLTTSGGPFWGKRHEALSSVTVEQALAHPTWRMGAKISIDSATLFNKGLEVIETHCLFDIAPEQIGVVAHQQSFVHSMVEFDDGSIKAQLSMPDMRLPILYALSYPARIRSDVVRTDATTLGTLTFEPIPARAFPCLDLAFEALRIGGDAPAAISAADEVAVNAFLDHRIRFTDIAGIVEDVLRDWPTEPLTDLGVVKAADVRARVLAEESIRRREAMPKVVTC